MATAVRVAVAGATAADAAGCSDRRVAAAAAVVLGFGEGTFLAAPGGSSAAFGVAFEVEGEGGVSAVCGVPPPWWVLSSTL
ncbi:hypothetical protein [Mycolicibacterium fluoranthenivorans]|uniref:Uncharacterized protein n=1 Tax=Mycolicibacterium fluoranthenivorans TaxID=258505 RepID=A0A7X5ZBH9_9MYCO|nr:hypothetical protein [Mycolicibacterium fluoranthenivorans]MCV7356866.1 hypothetical protein [Mycolicibacterium fluoranthenivorans]NIH94259.1 hypothetical protein [Mycolicibacterium fluoranthenivorans]